MFLVLYHKSIYQTGFVERQVQIIHPTVSLSMIPFQKPVHHLNPTAHQLVQDWLTVCAHLVTMDTNVSDRLVDSVCVCVQHSQ